MLRPFLHNAKDLTRWIQIFGIVLEGKKNSGMEICFPLENKKTHQTLYISGGINFQKLFINTPRTIAPLKHQVFPALNCPKKQNIRITQPVLVQDSLPGTALPIIKSLGVEL